MYRQLKMEQDNEKDSSSLSLLPPHTFLLLHHGLQSRLQGHLWSGTYSTSSSLVVCVGQFLTPHPALQCLPSLSQAAPDVRCRHLGSGAWPCPVVGQHGAAPVFPHAVAPQHPDTRCWYKYCVEYVLWKYVSPSVLVSIFSKKILDGYSVSLKPTEANHIQYSSRMCFLLLGSLH